MNELKDLMSNGNKKIGKDTLIFNIGTATNCLNRKLGICTIKNCYALKAEKQYPQVLPYRERQEKYFKNTSYIDILFNLKDILSSKRKPIKYIRINESGDFKSQKEIDKIYKMAEHFKEIVFYFYTKSFSYLDFNKNKPKNVRVIYSYNNYFEYIQYKEVKQKAFIFINKIMDIKEIQKNIKGSVICKGNCRTCNYCKVTKPLKVLVKSH